MSDATENPLLSFFDNQTALILDGGLATTLEDRGFDLNDELWSARVLLEEPEAIGQVHRDFLDAGADCITTATYQATLAGLQKQGLDRGQARSILVSAVDLAVSARDEFWSDPNCPTDRRRPLVAASIGPYGAFLADGSEYSGNYGIDSKELTNFHRDRWEILAAGRADLLACETLPNLDEARALLELLHRTPGRWAWFSFSCMDESSLCDGTPFAQAVELCTASSQVAAVGINCTAPNFIGPLLEIGRRTTDKLLIVYPNSGETFDPTTKTWAAAAHHQTIPELASAWVGQGAGAIGGCCRTGPAVIGDLRRHLLD